MSFRYYIIDEFFTVTGTNREEVVALARRDCQVIDTKEKLELSAMASMPSIPIKECKVYDEELKEEEEDEE